MYLLGSIREYYEVAALSMVLLPGLRVPEVTARLKVVHFVREIIVGRVLKLWQTL